MRGRERQQATEGLRASSWFAQQSSRALAILGCSVWASPAFAQTLTAQPEFVEPEPALEIHGFVSQGFIKSTDHDYLGPSERGSFEFTEVGINFTKQLTDELRVGMQIFAHDLGPLGNYKPQFDWYYIDYHFSDWLGIRMGRTKLPFGLYNEVNDIDAARVPILLPQSVYPAANRDVLLAQTGAELYGDVSLGPAGALEYRAYGGTIFLDTDNAVAFTNFTVPYMMGARLMWLPPILGLELGGSVQRLRFDLDFAPDAATQATYEADGVLPPDYSGTVAVRVPAWIWIASLQYQARDLLLAGEYTRSYVDIESSLLSPTLHDVNSGVYAMASYRVTDWLTPGVYYSFAEPGLKSRTGRSSYQNDLALTLRFDVNAHWLVKLEGHYMHGLAALDAVANGAATPAALNDREQDWGVFLIKTTAYF